MHFIIAEPGCFNSLPRVCALRSVSVVSQGTFKYAVRWQGYEAQDCVVSEEVLSRHLQRFPYEHQRFKKDPEEKKTGGCLFEVSSGGSAIATLGVLSDSTVQLHILDLENEVAKLCIPGVVVHPSFASGAEDYPVEISFLASKLHQQLMNTADNIMSIVVTSLATNYDALQRRLLSSGVYSSVDVLSNASLTETGMSGALRANSVLTCPSSFRNRRTKIICECPHCGSTFWDAAGLQSHMESRGVHACTCCALKFCYANQLRQHVRQKHVACQCGCETIQPDREAWNSHLLHQRNYPLTCVCKKQFQNPRGYYEHCKAKHPDDTWLVAIVTRQHFCANLETAVRTERTGREVFVMCAQCAQLIKVRALKPRPDANPLLMFSPVGSAGPSVESMLQPIDETLSKHKDVCSKTIPMHFLPTKTATDS